MGIGVLGLGFSAWGLEFEVMRFGVMGIGVWGLLYFYYRTPHYCIMFWHSHFHHQNHRHIRRHHHPPPPLFAVNGLGPAGAQHIAPSLALLTALQTLHLSCKMLFVQGNCNDALFAAEIWLGFCCMFWDVRGGAGEGKFF